jgi:uncharacterized protein (DUF2249 family)
MSAEPVRESDRVADVLARDGDLVDVFVRHSPHFEKLRNATLRRTMARLVTVGQAAAIAGVPPLALVRDLNDALGLTVELDEGVVSAGDDDPAATPPPRRPAGARETELDVREDLRQGREPFSRIMAAVGALGPGDVLHLRAPFEPAPLYTVLAKRGFAHETAQRASDDWSVWFWRPEATPEATDDVAPSATTTGRGQSQAEPDEQWIDVRGLEPPEPMVRTLAALETMPQGHTLVQVNERVPRFLLPILAERGFTHEIDESHADRVIVRIRRSG